MTKVREENARDLTLPVQLITPVLRQKTRIKMQIFAHIKPPTRAKKNSRGLIYHLSGQAIKIFSNTMLKQTTKNQEAEKHTSSQVMRSKKKEH